MMTYNCIVKLSDETDNAEDLYVIYKQKLNDKITKDYIPEIKNNISDSKEFLQIYHKKWK